MIAAQKIGRSMDQDIRRCNDSIQIKSKQKICRMVRGIDLDWCRKCGSEKRLSLRISLGAHVGSGAGKPTMRQAPCKQGTPKSYSAEK